MYTYEEAGERSKKTLAGRSRVSNTRRGVTRGRARCTARGRSRAIIRPFGRKRHHRTGSSCLTRLVNCFGAHRRSTDRADFQGDRYRACARVIIPARVSRNRAERAIYRGGTENIRKMIWITLFFPLMLVNSISVGFYFIWIKVLIRMLFQWILF